MQPHLQCPPLRTRALRRRRGLRRPGDLRAAAGTGTPLAPVPLQPPGGPLRPGIGHRPGGEHLLLPQRWRRDRPRRGPRLAGRRSGAARPQPCHAGQAVRVGLGPIPWLSPRPTSRPSSPATTGRSSAGWPCWCWSSAACPLRNPPRQHPSADPGSEHIFPSGRSPARWSGFGLGGQPNRWPRCRRQPPPNTSKITHKKSQAPMEGRPLAHVRYRLGHSLAGTPNAIGGPVGNSACSQGGSDCGERIKPRQRHPPGRPCHPAIYGSA